MLEKIKAVSNPLTTIAIFAGIAEMGGTVVLPLIDGEVQHIYVWFLIVFPTLLVALFFLTLNFNHKVLYAPSDFRKDDSFFRALTPQEWRTKLETEAKEVQLLKPSGDNAQPLPMTPKETEEFIRKYTLAEDLVLRELEAEYGRHVKRNVAMDYYKGTIKFDAAITLRRALIVVEVKLAQRPQLNYSIFNHLRELGRSVHDAAMQSGLYWNGSIMLVIVTMFSGEQHSEYVRRLELALRELDIQVELRVYNFETLKCKYEPNVA